MTSDETKTTVMNTTTRNESCYICPFDINFMVHNNNNNNNNNDTSATVASSTNINIFITLPDNIRTLLPFRTTSVTDNTTTITCATMNAMALSGRYFTLTDCQLLQQSNIPSQCGCTTTYGNHNNYNNNETTISSTTTNDNSISINASTTTTTNNNTINYDWINGSNDHQEQNYTATTNTTTNKEMIMYQVISIRLRYVMGATILDSIGYTQAIEMFLQEQWSNTNLYHDNNTNNTTNTNTNTNTNSSFMDNSTTSTDDDATNLELKNTYFHVQLLQQQSRPSTTMKSKSTNDTTDRELGPNEEDEQQDEQEEEEQQQQQQFLRRRRRQQQLIRQQDTQSKMGSFLYNTKLNRRSIQESVLSVSVSVSAEYNDTTTGNTSDLSSYYNYYYYILDTVVNISVTFIDTVVANNNRTMEINDNPFRIDRNDTSSNTSSNQNVTTTEFISRPLNISATMEEFLSLSSLQRMVRTDQSILVQYIQQSDYSSSSSSSSSSSTNYSTIIRSNNFYDPLENITVLDRFMLPSNLSSVANTSLDDDDDNTQEITNNSTTTTTAIPTTSPTTATIAPSFASPLLVSGSPPPSPTQSVPISSIIFATLQPSSVPTTKTPILVVPTPVSTSSTGSNTTIATPTVGPLSSSSSSSSSSTSSFQLDENNITIIIVSMIFVVGAIIIAIIVRRRCYCMGSSSSSSVNTRNEDKLKSKHDRTSTSLSNPSTTPNDTLRPITKSMKMQFPTTGRSLQSSISPNYDDSESSKDHGDNNNITTSSSSGNNSNSDIVIDCTTKSRSFMGATLTAMSNAVDAILLEANQNSNISILDIPPPVPATVLPVVPTDKSSNTSYSGTDDDAIMTGEDIDDNGDDDDNRTHRLSIDVMKFILPKGYDSNRYSIPPFTTKSPKKDIALNNSFDKESGISLSFLSSSNHDQTIQTAALSDTTTTDNTTACTNDKASGAPIISSPLSDRHMTRYKLPSERKKESIKIKEISIPTPIVLTKSVSIPPSKEPTGTIKTIDTMDIQFVPSMETISSDDEHQRRSTNVTRLEPNMLIQNEILPPSFQLFFTDTTDGRTNNGRTIGNGPICASKQIMLLQPPESSCCDDTNFTSPAQQESKKGGSLSEITTTSPDGVSSGGYDPRVSSTAQRKVPRIYCDDDDDDEDDSFIGKTIQAVTPTTRNDGTRLPPSSASNKYIQSTTTTTATTTMSKGGTRRSNKSKKNSRAANGAGNVVSRTIFVPSGKLGIVVDTTNEGQIIRNVDKSSSPLAGVVSPGDIIIAINDIETQSLNSFELTDLMMRTAGLPKKFTVLSTRTTASARARDLEV